MARTARHLTMATATLHFMCAFIVKARRVVSVFVLAGAIIAGIGVKAAENTSPATQPHVLSPWVAALSAHAELPDPFLSDDGTRLTSPKQWLLRRQELLELI